MDLIKYNTLYIYYWFKCIVYWNIVNIILLIKCIIIIKSSNLFNNIWVIKTTIKNVIKASKSV